MRGKEHMTNWKQKERMNNRNRCTENLSMLEMDMYILYILDMWILHWLFYICFGYFRNKLFNMIEKLEDKILNFGRAQGTTKIMTGNRERQNGTKTIFEETMTDCLLKMKKIFSHSLKTIMNSNEGWVQKKSPIGAS